MAYLKTKNRRKSTEKVNSNDFKTDRKIKAIEKRKAKEKTAKFISFMSVAIVFGIIVGTPLGLIVSPKIGIAGFLTVTFMFFSYQYPRTSLWVFLIYMPFGGTFTYWVGEGNSLFQIAKDVFYIPALLALIVDCRRKQKPIIVAKNLMPTLSFLVILAVITFLVVNGSKQLLPSCEYLKSLNIEAACKYGEPFLQGILGLKVLIGYIPLIFCAYYLIEDKKQLLFLGRLLALLAVICCLLALIQWWFLKTGRCEGTVSTGATGGELFKASLKAKCFVGGSLLYTPEQGQIRLPGTFVSPWHWGWFLIANSAITFIVAFFETSFFWRLIGLSGMALVFINSLISGQRIALVLVPIFIFIMLILTGQITKLKQLIPIGIILIITVMGFIAKNPGFVQQRIDSFILRWQTAPPYEFILTQFDFALRNYQYYSLGGILGAGLGSATNSARSFGATSFLETFHPKLIYEIGFIGLFAFMAFITHLTIYTFKQYQSLRDPILRSFGSAFWVFILLIGYFPYWYPLDTDPVAVYYWLFAGILIKLPFIDKQERHKEMEEIVNTNKFKRKGLPRLKKRQQILN